MSFPALRHERPCKNNKKKKEEQKDVWELNAENAHWSDKVAENLEREWDYEKQFKRKLKILSANS